MGLVMSRPAVVMRMPERIAERGRSKPQAGSRRDARVAACRCRRSGTTRRPASERRKRARHRYPTQRTSREDPPCQRRGSRTRMRNMAVHVAHDRRARARLYAGQQARSASHAARPRHRRLPRPPRASLPRPPPRTPSTQPRTTGSAGSAPAARRRGICASTTWMRNHAGNDRMGRRSAATARSGDTTAAAYRRRGDDDMAET